MHSKEKADVSDSSRKELSRPSAPDNHDAHDCIQASASGSLDVYSI